MTSRFSSILAAYEGLGFHLGAQPPGAKAGYGHKPGDWSFVPMSADFAAECLGQGKANVSCSPVAPYAFLDMDGVPIAQVKQALGLGTWTHRTARGRHHMLVELATPRLATRNGAITTAKGCIDVKGAGGYVIVPGSRTADGIYTGRMGIIPRIDDPALDALLAMIDGKLAADMPRIQPPKPLYAEPVSKSEMADRVEGAKEALRLRLPGEFPAGAGTYQDWTVITWALCIYAGAALQALWDAYTVETGRLPFRGHPNFHATWRKTPADFGAGAFCKRVNQNARERGIQSPLPRYRESIAVEGWDVSEFATLEGA